SITLAAAATSVSPIMALVVVIGLIAALAMLTSSTLCAVVLCFSLPFERIGRFTNDVDPVTVSAARILGLIALASLLLHATLHKEKLNFGIAFFLYAGYTSVALMSNAWVYEPQETSRDGIRILGNLLFFFTIVNLIRDYATAKKVLIAWLLATFIAG